MYKSVIAKQLSHKSLNLTRLGFFFFGGGGLSLMAAYEKLVFIGWLYENHT